MITSYHVDICVASHSHLRCYLCSYDFSYFYIIHFFILFQPLSLAISILFSSYTDSFPLYPHSLSVCLSSPLNVYVLWELSVSERAKVITYVVCLYRLLCHQVVNCHLSYSYRTTHWRHWYLRTHKLATIPIATTTPSFLILFSID